MGAGSHGATSTIFYRRGVPNNFKDFGAVVAGNYAIYQPTTAIFKSNFFRNSISSFIRVSR
jgi:hypothetical protein